MTLVSSVNNIASDREFILMGRSFIYIMNNRALELILGELRISVYTSQRKKF